MRWRKKPSQEPSREGYSLPSRIARRNTPGRRILRYWREALALLLVVVVVGTVVILVNFKEDEKPVDETPWIDRIQVSGAVGRIPTLVITEPVSVASSKIKDIEIGTGREITADSPLIIAISSFDGATGQILDPEGRGRIEIGLANEKDFQKTMLDGLIGKPEGSRVLFVRPVSVDGEKQTEINVVDILHSAASGEAVEDNGKPLTVTMTDTGPNIKHASKEAPSELTIQTLVKGDGQQVRPEDNVLAQYVSASWGTEVVHESTWWTGIPQVINLKTAMPGIRHALVDQRVGTRIAVTIPPELASGDSTLMMVIDIIGTEPQDGTLTPVETTETLPETSSSKEDAP